MRFKRSLMLLGDAGSGKSTLLDAIARYLTVSHKAPHYLKSSSLDAYGALTIKGKTAESGCYTFDEYSLVSRNNSPLDVNEIKQLLTVDKDSSWGCRYRASSLVAKREKIFASQYDDNEDAISPVGDLNTPLMVLPFIRHILNGKAEEINKLSSDMKAIARRMVCVHVVANDSTAEVRKMHAVIQKQHVEREAANLVALEELLNQ